MHFLFLSLYVFLEKEEEEEENSIKNSKTKILKKILILH